jgi:hypothetical protein
LLCQFESGTFTDPPLGGIGDMATFSENAEERAANTLFDLVDR